MITLHRLGHIEECFQLNPDLIVSVESTPDTVITLATNAKVVVADTPEQVAGAVRGWRADVLLAALGDRGTHEQPATAHTRRACRELATIKGGSR
jgi:flagellar protein FlbD